MHKHPTPTIKGSRPQNLPHNQSEEIRQLSATYLKRRNHAIDLKSKAAEVELAQKRGILVEKRLVEAQAVWLLIAMRRKLMNLQSHGHRFLGLTDINQARQLLHEIGLSVLSEIRDLPKTVNPGWLKEVEADEGK
jgi:hypothetical protein